jgi:catalase
VVTADQAIETIRETGGAQPGSRALHAKGKLYRGTFIADREAAGLSRASHMNGSPVPILVRFSNGSGRPDPRDGAPGIRGMAVKFTLPDGSTTDVSMQTAKLFPVGTPDGFVGLLRAMRANLATPVRIAKLLAANPKLPRSLLRAGAPKVPVSYATIDYHGLHAFRWVDADGGSRFVRYHLSPAAGEQFLRLPSALSKDPDFLTDELDRRVADGPVRFYFRVQLAGPKDSTVDPSASWKNKTMVTVGTLDITGIDTEREKDGDIVVFDPMRVTDGIEPSDDPVLRFRTHAYSASVKLRSGVDRGAEAPPG